MNRILITLMAIGAAVSAEALTLQEARQLAVDNYPLVRDYDLIALTERYTLQNAAKAWLPQVEVGAQATWQTDVSAYPDVLKEMLSQRGMDLKGMSPWQWKAQVDVHQVIWDGGRIKASQDVAKREAEEDRLSNEVELYRLRGHIDDIYFSLLLLSQQGEAIRSSIALLQANLDRVNSLVVNGAAMQSDADAIEAELLSTKQQLVSVQSAMKAYRKILALYVGARADEELEEPTPVMLPSANDSRMRPEQRLMSARQETLLARQSQVRKESMPQIGAFAQGYFGYPGMNFMESMMNRDPSFNAMLGVSVSWNIGSLYTRKNKLLSLQAAADRVDVSRRVFEFNTDVQATQYRTEIDRLREISESDKAIVELRGRVRNASEARLREGIVEPTDLLLRITDEKNALISANSHRIEYLKAIYQLQNTLNYE